jgi:hypothetical protein
MAELSNPSLQITISSSSEADVDARVDVGLTPLEQFLINAAGLRLQLRCTLRGSDLIIDNNLFNFEFQDVPGTNSFTFARRLPRSILDEDSPLQDDEIYARFRLVSLEPIFPLDLQRDSSVVTGSF